MSLISRKTIRIKFQNGLNFNDFKNEVFEIEGLNEIYNFVESEQPEFVIFGPYKNDIPKKSENYIRIGYFYENIKPDLNICEWAFGTRYEEDINQSKYKRIQWHGLNPSRLVKNITENDIDFIVNSKRRFCNFLYSNEVPFRENFYKQLSKYKLIDSPGKSMNNMDSIDSIYTGNVWERKRNFLNNYKFTIAFENYSYPGYHTEKLFDSMLANSIPIYLGDLDIYKVFNTKSFINACDFMNIKVSPTINFLEKTSQATYKENAPRFYNSMQIKITRKVKHLLRSLKMAQQFGNQNFDELIDNIIEIDRDQTKYANMLRQPWFTDNQMPKNSLNKERWIEIFSKNN